MRQPAPARPQRRIKAPLALVSGQPLMPRAEAATLTRAFADLTGSLPVGAFVKDAEGRYIYANSFLIRSLGRRTDADWYGRTDAEMVAPAVAREVRDHDEGVLSGGIPRAFSRTLPFADGPHSLVLIKFPFAGGDGRAFLAGIGVDVTERDRTEAERDRLATAIEQVAESVVIADVDGAITYVNPAFEHLTGYTSAEVIGQNPRLLSSGVQPTSFYEAMWATLKTGKPWIADFVNRRKDGSLVTVEAVISPISDAANEITSYVAVNRDVTRERVLQARSDQAARERALIGDTIRGLRAGDTAEATAQAICRQVASLTGVTAAQLFILELDGRAAPLGFVVPGRADPPLRPLPYERSQHLEERAAQGPWIEPWTDRPGHPYNDLINSLGIHLVAYAPIRYNGGLVGFLVIDSARTVDETALTGNLAALVEFADLAGALIGRDVAERTAVNRGRDEIQSIIDSGAFRPVFQPIVELATDTVVGYEALTRFVDGVSPDVRFREAHQVGLGLQLEIATLGAAMATADGLPAGAWVNVNVSPALIEAGDTVRGLVANSRRRLVLEVTEHVEIADYARFRAALTALGPQVELAVDDAGAGFASLRHILELRPAFVKLDRWLVTGIEADEARQAMIVGLRHFARATSCQLIAEGIETEAELGVLRRLDIDLGQGYLLGRPVPVGKAGSSRRPLAARKDTRSASASTPASGR